jgi:hypothetical protein
MKFTRNLPVWLIGTTIALTQPHIAIAINLG